MNNAGYILASENAVASLAFSVEWRSAGTNVA